MENKSNGNQRIIAVLNTKPTINSKDYVYNKKENEEFLNNFYKEKGVKCWAKDCPNKILQAEGDHKKVKIPCQENHTRMVCLEHSKEYE